MIDPVEATTAGPAEGWREPAALRAFSEFIAGWRFPVLLFGALAGFAILLGGLAVFPASESGLGAFASEFRQWCFGWDPATGRMIPMALVTALLSPVVLSAVLVVLWAEPLRAARRLPRRRVAATAILGAVMVAIACGGLLAFEPGAATGALPFPAESLRTALPAPDLSLRDHEGQPVTLAALRGRVVMLTAVYARCGSTCPMILSETRAALAALEPGERADLVVLGVTLDPVHDDEATLARLALAHGLAAPSVRLLTGEPAAVERVLDRMGVARERDPVTGIIEHQNVFLLVDRRGRVAYRLALGDRQKAWLVQAIRRLIAEDGGEAST